jgi:hypothetical protein
MNDLDEKILYLHNLLGEKKILDDKEFEMCNQLNVLMKEMNELCQKSEALSLVLEKGEKKSVPFFLRRFVKSKADEYELIKREYYHSVKTYNSKSALVKDLEGKIEELSSQKMHIGEFEINLQKLLTQKEFILKNEGTELSRQITILAENNLALLGKINSIKVSIKQFSEFNLPLKEIRNIVTSMIDKGRIEYGGASESNSYAKIQALRRLETLKHKLSIEFELENDVLSLITSPLKNLNAYAMKISAFVTKFEKSDIYDMVIRRRIADIHDSTLSILNDLNNVELYLNEEISKCQSLIEINNKKKYDLILNDVIKNA